MSNRRRPRADKLEPLELLEPLEELPSFKSANHDGPQCGAELLLESDRGTDGWRFVCTRPAGHTLVHIDNAHARANGVPAWSMVWP